MNKHGYKCIRIYGICKYVNQCKYKTLKERNNECNHGEDVKGLIGSFMMSKEITRMNALGKRPIIPHHKDVKNHVRKLLRI